MKRKLTPNEAKNELRDHLLFDIEYDRDLCWRSENQHFAECKGTFKDNDIWSAKEFFHMFNCNSRDRKAKLINDFQGETMKGVSPLVSFKKIAKLFEQIENYQLDQLNKVNQDLANVSY